MTTATPRRAHQLLSFEPGYVTPECRTGQQLPDFEGACPKCPHPGYQDPNLGWQDRPCACEHHEIKAS